MATNPSTPTLPAPQAGRKYFGLAEANRALPYVSRVVEDICTTYRQAVAIQHRMEYPQPEDDVDRLRSDYEQSVNRLNGFTEELRDVGAELKDYELGLIDFPAIHQGRAVYLCWKRGENHIVAWHELDAGLAGRHDVSELEESPAK